MCCTRASMACQHCESFVQPDSLREASSCQTPSLRDGVQGALTWDLQKALAGQTCPLRIQWSWPSKDLRSKTCWLDQHVHPFGFRDLTHILAVDSLHSLPCGTCCLLALFLCMLEESTPCTYAQSQLQ